MGGREWDIQIDGEAIIVKDWPRLYQILFQDIEGIFALQYDMLTFFENFLIALVRGGREFAFGELDDGFKPLEAALRERFCLPSDWQAQLELGGPGTQVQLWLVPPDGIAM